MGLSVPSLTTVWCFALIAVAPTCNWPMASQKDEDVVDRVARFMAQNFGKEPGHPQLINNSLKEIFSQHPEIIPPYFIPVVLRTNELENRRRTLLKAREDMWLASSSHASLSRTDGSTSNASLGGFQPLDRWMSTHAPRTLLEVSLFSSRSSLPSIRLEALWNFYRLTGGPGVANMPIKKFKSKLRKFGYKIDVCSGISLVRGVELAI